MIQMFSYQIRQAVLALVAERKKNVYKRFMFDFFFQVTFSYKENFTELVAKFKTCGHVASTLNFRPASNKCFSEMEPFQFRPFISAGERRSGCANT